jgi:hypothetical protein
VSQPHPELLVLVITLIAIGLAPVASRLVKNIGQQISSELDGGRTGTSLNNHLDDAYEGSMEAEEIRQMVEARAFVRGEEMPDVDGEVARIRAAQEGPPQGDQDELREEIRYMVIASNERRLRMGEQPFDVEAETARRLARYLGSN